MCCDRIRLEHTARKHSNVEADPCRKRKRTEAVFGLMCEQLLAHDSGNHTSAEFAAKQTPANRGPQAALGRCCTSLALPAALIFHLLTLCFVRHCGMSVADSGLLRVGLPVAKAQSTCVDSAAKPADSMQRAAACWSTEHTTGLPRSCRTKALPVLSSHAKQKKLNLEDSNLSKPSAHQAAPMHQPQLASTATSYQPAKPDAFCMLSHASADSCSHHSWPVKQVRDFSPWS